MLAFLSFFLLWLMMSGEVTVSVCVWGLCASLLMAVFCRRVLGYRLFPERGGLGKVGAAAAYLSRLVWEMLKAGFVVMKLIYTRGREMEPKLVWFDTTLKTPGAQAVLANSITLTAGTITVTAADGRFCVHALDASLAEGIENCDFQRRLEKLEA